MKIEENKTYNVWRRDSNGKLTHSTFRINESTPLLKGWDWVLVAIVCVIIAIFRQCTGMNDVKQPNAYDNPKPMTEQERQETRDLWYGK